MPPPQRYIDPEPVNMALFGKKGLADHPELLEWVVSPLTSVFLRDRREDKEEKAI